MLDIVFVAAALAFTYKPAAVEVLLRRNILIYGLGGIIVPFIGIKAIDLLVAALGLA